MSQHPSTVFTVPEIDSFRAALASVARDRRQRRTVDGVECVRCVVPEGLHATLWRCGALARPGLIALAWLRERAVGQTTETA